MIYYLQKLQDPCYDSFGFKTCVKTVVVWRKFVGLLKELANIATHILPYLIPKNPC
jgi:glucosamine 6-phosphate synthetase-like amidotransferase/phosphosugar isomerase protein